MKLLRIENSCGQFLLGEGRYESLDKLTKEDLLRLVDLSLSEEVEFDEYEEAALRNQAHRIIYRSVYEKLSELSDRREEFIDESERLYLDDYEKYRVESTSDEEF